MDLTFSEQEQAFRAECRSWLEANIPQSPLESGDTRAGFAQHIEWEKKLFDARWAVVSWPREYGGREASLFEWLIFEEEYYRAGAPNRVTQNGIFLLAPILFEFGTQEQKDRILPRMAAAEVLWAQAWSEPNAGSDLASLKSTAKRDEEAKGWLLNGQKTWCTRGAFCDWVYGLFRSDPEAQRHRGLSYFMIPLDAPGVTVRGVPKLDGDEGFAEVFFDDAFVADENMIGAPNQGWNIAMATTGSERGLTLRSPGRFVAMTTRLSKLYQRFSDSADPQLRSQVAQAWIEAQAYRMYTYQSVTQMVKGENMGASSSMNKIFWSEMDLRAHETALALLGPLAELEKDSPEAIDDGRWLKDYLFSLAGPIYAGTNEIQRNIVAQRVLGLPRK